MRKWRSFFIEIIIGLIIISPIIIISELYYESNYIPIGHFTNLFMLYISSSLIILCFFTKKVYVQILVFGIACVIPIIFRMLQGFIFSRWKYTFTHIMYGLGISFGIAIVCTYLVFMNTFLNRMSKYFFFRITVCILVVFCIGISFPYILNENLSHDFKFISKHPIDQVVLSERNIVVIFQDGRFFLAPREKLQYIYPLFALYKRPQHIRIVNDCIYMIMKYQEDEVLSELHIINLDFEKNKMDSSEEQINNTLPSYPYNCISPEGKYIILANGDIFTTHDSTFFNSTDICETYGKFIAWSSDSSKILYLSDDDWCIHTIFEDTTIRIQNDSMYRPNTEYHISASHNLDRVVFVSDDGYTLIVASLNENDAVKKYSLREMSIPPAAYPIITMEEKGLIYWLDESAFVYHTDWPGYLLWKFCLDTDSVELISPALAEMVFAYHSYGGEVIYATNHSNDRQFLSIKKP